MIDSHDHARLPTLDETASDDVLVRAAQGGDNRAFRAILTRWNS